MLLRDAAEKFILDKKVYCAPKTIENYTDHLIRFLQFAPDNLEQLSPDVLREYVIEMRQRKIRNSKFNRNRIIPLCPRLKELLQQYNSGSEYVILSRTGRQLSTEAIKHMFQKLKNRSGIQRVHAHLCRHTFATSYMMGGGNLEKLRVMLGHSDYNVTKIYLQLAAEYEIVKYPIYQLDKVFFEKGY